MTAEEQKLRLALENAREKTEQSIGGFAAAALIVTEFANAIDVLRRYVKRLRLELGVRLRCEYVRIPYQCV